VGALNEEMQRLVRGQRLGYVATTRADGTPNLSPKGTLDVWDEDHLIFADLASPGTIGNLRARPSVEINVVDVAARKGFRFRGTARIVEEGPELARAIAHYEANGVTRPKERVRAVAIIRVLSATPVWSPAYDIGATEADTRRRWTTYYLALWQTGEAPPAPD
jgi:predicted pyridoxine 5'-phosphate oxidase superfamily flavin-nucleotide-binding protein